MAGLWAGLGRTGKTAPAGSTPSSGKPRRSQQQYISRCHVFDICQVLKASIARPRVGALYNIVDNEPAPRTEVAMFVQSLREAKPTMVAMFVQSLREAKPTMVAMFVQSLREGSDQATPTAVTSDLEPAVSDKSSSPESSLEASAPRHSREGEPLEEKRVRKTLLRTELGVELRYPTYREGMTAIFDGETSPFSAADMTAMFGQR
eukprot:gene7472-615_t